jgi:hypothetical protein
MTSRLVIPSMMSSVTAGVDQVPPRRMNTFEVVASATPPSTVSMTASWKPADSASVFARAGPT